MDFRTLKITVMTKILFVCHGNICRSPMAEFVLKTLATEPFSPNGLIRERDCLPYT